MKSKAIAEFGDFQTPRELAAEVCALLAAQGTTPRAVVEPTCGLGSFLFAALDQFPDLEAGFGAEINPEYVKRAVAELASRPDASKAHIAQVDFFATDWEEALGNLPDPLLILGNLPWVTNTELEVLGSRNLPHKSNFQRRKGMDAITGKANFDISEWMLIRLLEAVSARRGILAMLVKSAVARKALFHAWKNDLRVERSAIYRIDAARHFDAAVDSALLVTHFAPDARDYEAKVYPRLSSADASTVIGYEQGSLFADREAFQRCRHLAGEERIKWRSGIKHDCAKVMEFRAEGGKLRNGLGELVELEDEYLYPMLKSSGVANGNDSDDLRWMLVTQTAVGADTAEIQERAPRAWTYLESHTDLFARRASSIYRDRPRFSIFGVGEYSFSPWKVAISGFYKRLVFTPVGPVMGRPVVFDDTSYFLPCEDQAAADYLASLLNSDRAREFYAAFVFWDAKRPITADLLRRLDLLKLADEIGSRPLFDHHFGPERTLAESSRTRVRKTKGRGHRTFDFVDVLPKP